MYKWSDIFQNDLKDVRCQTVIIVSAIRPKVFYCMVQYSYLNYGLCKQPSLMIAACLYGFLPLLKWTYKEIHRSNTLKNYTFACFFVLKNSS